MTVLQQTKKERKKKEQHRIVGIVRRNGDILSLSTEQMVNKRKMITRNEVVQKKIVKPAKKGKSE